MSLRILNQRNFVAPHSTYRPTDPKMADFLCLFSDSVGSDQIEEIDCSYNSIGSIIIYKNYNKHSI